MTGFSLPYVAKYSASGGVATYSEGMRLARGVSVSVEAEIGESDPFFADNVEAETTPGKFSGGTATYTVDGLFPEAETLILGLPEPEDFSYGESKTVKIYNYGDAMSPPYVGTAFIARYQSDGVESYVPILLTKNRFQTPSLNANTQEDAIEYQTQELVADLMRDDTPAHNWKKIGEAQSTEAEAEEIIKALFNITE